MEPIKSVNEALLVIDNFSGTATEFRLPIADSLLDAIGVNMAIITDKILARGFMPNGFEQEDGYRIYTYKDL